MVIVTVTTHYYDGKKSFPIEIKLDQYSSSLAKGKDDELFKKKPDIGIELIDRSLSRGLSHRNWIEVFYREAKMMVRVKRISSKR